MTIDLLPSKTREASEIIAIRTNKEESLLAVISGKNLCMSEQFANQLFLFRRVMNTIPTEPDQFVFDRKFVLKDMEGFERFSMQFYFKISQTDQDLTTLIFAKKDKIFEFNYSTGELRDVCVY